MAQTIDFVSVKEEERALWQDYTKRELEIVKDPGPFLQDLRALLKKMRAVSANLTAVEDYVWLHEAVRKWRLLSSSSLNTPSEITLLPPAQPLRPPRGDAETTPEQWRDRKASELCTRRLLTRYYATSEQEIVRRELEKLSPGERKSEELFDWYQAGTYLAEEVLDGRMSFLRRFTPESYKELEGECWLDELRKLKAHRLWRDRGNWGEDAMRQNYLDACQEIRQKLLDPDAKLSQSASEPILDYIRTSYLQQNKDGLWTLDVAKTHAMIEIKARRLWQLRGWNDERSNWYRAEQYVKDYYENITPAMGGDRKKIQRVADVLQLEGDAQEPNLVNCFEIAIAIHFLDHRAMPEYLQRAHGAKAS